jgi:hypothetical protein
MSQKTTLQAFDKTGKLQDEIEVDVSQVEAFRKKAEGRGFIVQEKQPISAQQTKAAETKTITEIGPKSSMVGGLLQGLSLGTEDIIGEDTEKLRLRQEAEHPYLYGGAKFIGSLVPSIAAAGAGGLAGAKLGGAIGAAGGPIGAAGGAAIGGLLGAGGAGLVESYASKPTPEEGKSLEASDVAMGAASAGAELIGRALAPVGRSVYRGIRGKFSPAGSVPVKGATEIAEQNMSMLADRLNNWQAIKQRIAANKKLVSGDELLQKSDEEIYDMLDMPDAEEAISIKRALESEIKALGATDYKKADAAIEVLQKQLAQAQAITARSPSTQIAGGAGAAVPMITPDVALEPLEVEELNREAARRAMENLSRKPKTKSKESTPTGIRKGTI